MAMFDWMYMSGNYGARKVGRYEYEHGFVSTARATDGRRPFETAVQDSRYGRTEDWGEGPTFVARDEMVIVEAYNTKEEAIEGHQRWEALMKSDTPPKKLVECCNAGIAEWVDDLGGTMDQVYQPE